MSRIEIEDGFFIPQVGLAAFQLESHDRTVEHFTKYFLSGGRLVEMAELFTNYGALELALQKAHLERKDIFISLKIWPQNLTPEDLLGKIEAFFQRNRIDYVDILMVHAPIDINNRFEQWRSLEIIKKRQWTRALGIANMSLNELMTVIKNAEILPTVFQLELSPFHPQRDVQDYCTAGQIVLLNSEPICKGLRDRHPLIIELSQALNISSEQLLFRWSIAKGFVTYIPASAPRLGLSPHVLAGEMTEDGHVTALPPEVMDRLDDLDEELLTTWAPVVEEDT